MLIKKLLDELIPIKEYHFLPKKIFLFHKEYLLVDIY